MLGVAFGATIAPGGVLGVTFGATIAPGGVLGVAGGVLGVCDKAGAVRPEGVLSRSSPAVPTEMPSAR